MNAILQLVSPDGLWKRSPFSELPAVPRNASESTRHFCVIAGGIALLLSRCSSEGIARHYPRANSLYRQIRAELRKGCEVSASAELLSDVMHEVAEQADPTTRSSLRFCFDSRCRDQRRDASGSAVPAQFADTVPPGAPGIASKTSRLDSIRATLESQRVAEL